MEGRDREKAEQGPQRPDRQMPTPENMAFQGRIPPEIHEKNLAEAVIPGQEKAPRSESVVTLPDPPEKAYSDRYYRSSNLDYKLSREDYVAPQEQFSDRVTDIVLPPIRAELANGNLAHFLRQLNRQQGDDQKKLGVIFLINDNAKDKTERENVIDENRDIADYIKLISAKNAEGLGELPISDEYKALGKKIIEDGKLEVRYDKLGSSLRYAHFGALRTHLFRLAKAFKNERVPDTDIVVHLSDIDTTYTSDHFQTLQKFYKDPTNEANFSEQDLMPGVHEGAESWENLTRDLLLSLDEHRYRRYHNDTGAMLAGEILSGSPIISGRLSSFFADEQLDPGLLQLGDKITGEDFTIGEYLKDRTPFGKKLGNVGEVHRQNRARKPYTANTSQMDAEDTYNFTTRLREGKRQPADNTTVQRMEKAVEHASFKLFINDSQPDSFRESDEYKTLLQDEMKKEQAKVRLRRIRLGNYIDSLGDDKKELGENEKETIDPYIQYFADETDTMKQKLAAGLSPQEISASYIRKYDSFFNSDAPIHTYIAKMRALKNYVFMHRLRLLDPQLMPLPK